MKISTLCMKCLEIDGVPNLRMSDAEINNEFVFKTTCDKGHETFTYFQQERFELLFDMGCMALLDGYYRESVFSISASIERFHEFFIRVVSIHREIPFASFTETWKAVENQSERQLGAFYFLYLAEFSSAPPDYLNKNAAFRNKVVHKGYIPTKTETLKYARGAFEYITCVLAVLRKDYQSSISILISKNALEAQAKFKNTKIATLAQLSFIGLISGEKGWEDRNFDDEMPKFFNQRKIIDTTLHGIASPRP